MRGARSRQHVARLIALLLLLLPSSASPASLADVPTPALDVPFLPQTEALCGGAAVAMVMRFWGERHADVQRFAPLVDWKRGGIDAQRLLEAVREQGWRAERVAGGLDRIREHLAARVPLILLIEDQPASRRREARYHFVVAVGATADSVTIHDPTWGPGRRFATAELQRVWAAADFWAIAIHPGPGGPSTPAAAPPTAATAPAAAASPRSAGTCDSDVDAAIAAASSGEFERADRLLANAAGRCPGSSRPLSERAGLRFSQRRYSDAATFAVGAVRRDRNDAYAWDVLGSSRFLNDDPTGALRAWNVLGRPQLDSVTIEGLTRTRYAAVAAWLPLIPNTLLTADAFAAAARQASAIPAFTRTRLRLIPEDDGWARVELAALERRRLPAGGLEWGVWAARTAIDRDVRLDLPGWTGQGELWSGGWRWWRNRPRVDVAFAAPANGRVRGVWRVDGFWAAQAFSSANGAEDERETQRHGGVAFTNWPTANLRYELSTALDAWSGGRRTWATGIELERRFANDRVALVGNTRAWWPFDGGPRFAVSSVSLRLRSSNDPRRLEVVSRSGASVATMAAPRLLWPAAGDVGSGSPTLRAHPLTDDGVIRGDGFGRRLAFASIEPRSWFSRPRLVRIGVAAFVDLARARRRADAAADSRVIVDAGVGVRIRFPGAPHVLRVDYGRGLRDGANVFSVGWQP